MIEKTRKTKETDIVVRLELMGNGESTICTRIGFFDHMLEAMARHGWLNLKLECRGDTHIDFHHSVEDSGIVLGQALNESLFPVKGIERYGNAVAVMDEAAVQCDLDISHRPFLLYDIGLDGKIGDFDAELIEEFFRALVMNAGLTVHLVLLRGKNRHHIAEAAFKAFAVALRRAATPTSRVDVASTKGVL